MRRGKVTIKKINKRERGREEGRIGRGSEQEGESQGNGGNGEGEERREGLHGGKKGVRTKE